MSNVQVTEINGMKIYNLTGGKTLYELMKESNYNSTGPRMESNNQQVMSNIDKNNLNRLSLNNKVAQESTAMNTNIFLE